MTILKGLLQQGWTNTWQKFTPDRNAPLAGIFIKLENPNANSYNLALEIYASDDDATAVNPNNKFSGVPFDKSDTVTINGNFCPAY
ncbi:MAG: hypothetical protein Ct9H90mP20_2710 [Candidatus Neomarinimicrobiota bacterium]|nr:MAG: hypothetical protein Ct9H90mP20_2710 [Candidatus Neomarinimicrobiota bacterium]